ncbi:MAG: MBL fold metallo-hydrolase [Clostridia bacterium]|nr:MBL fold metallo-hydrolase [Clostridia bacterium]
MKITYLGHSGFLVETDTRLLLFDYYTGTIPPLSADKPLFVFASHHHPDHMNGAVFSICKTHPSVHYILSHDISAALPAHYGIAEYYHVKHTRTLEIAGCRITTLRSTDCGVAYLVTCGGKTIFHAGDLNLWLWSGMDRMQSFGMMKRFTEYTAPLKEYHIDLAFLTLDNRQGEAAYLNIDYYMRHFSIDTAVPMHYFGSTEIADRFLADPSSEPYRHRVLKMEEGDTKILS